MLKQICIMCEEEIGFAEWAIYHNSKKRPFCSNKCFEKWFEVYFKDKLKGSFKWALEQLRRGKKVRRPSWKEGSYWVLGIDESIQWNGVRPAHIHLNQINATDFEIYEELCEWCKHPIRIRNPTGGCDHLYYPENVNKAYPEIWKEVMKCCVCGIIDERKDVYCKNCGRSPHEIVRVCRGKIIETKLTRKQAEELADIGLRTGLLKKEDYESSVEGYMKPRTALFK